MITGSTKYGGVIHCVVFVHSNHRCFIAVHKVDKIVRAKTGGCLNIGASHGIVCQLEAGVACAMARSRAVINTKLAASTIICRAVVDRSAIFSVAGSRSESGVACALKLRRWRQ